MLSLIVVSLPLHLSKSAETMKPTETLRVLAGSSLARWLNTKGCVSVIPWSVLMYIFYRFSTRPGAFLDSREGSQCWMRHDHWSLQILKSCEFRPLAIRQEAQDIVGKSFISDSDRCGSSLGLGSYILWELRQVIKSPQTSVFLYIQWRWAYLYQKLFWRWKR